MTSSIVGVLYNNVYIQINISDCLWIYRKYVICTSQIPGPSHLSQTYPNQCGYKPQCDLGAMVWFGLVASQLTLLLLISIDRPNHRHLGKIMKCNWIAFICMHITGSFGLCANICNTTLLAKSVSTKHFWWSTKLWCSTQNQALMFHSQSKDIWQSFTNSHNHIYPYEFGCKGVKTYANKWLVLGRLSVRGSDIFGDISSHYNICYCRVNLSICVSIVTHIL